MCALLWRRYHTKFDGGIHNETEKMHTRTREIELDWKNNKFMKNKTRQKIQVRDQYIFLRKIPLYSVYWCSRTWKNSAELYGKKEVRVAWAQNDNVHSLVINSKQNVKMHNDNTHIVCECVRVPNRRVFRCVEKKHGCCFILFCFVCSNAYKKCVRNATIPIGSICLIINFSERKNWTGK